MAKNNFDILKEMSERNLEIGMMPDFVSGQTTKKGCHITMGAPAEVLNKIMTGEWKPMLFVVNMKQFNEILDRKD